MNTGKSIACISVTAIIVLAVSVAAFSQPPRGGPGAGRPGMGQQPMMGYLLTPEQQRTVTAIQQNFREASSETVKKLWEQELQLMTALAAEELDEDRVRSIADSISALRSDLYRQQVGMYLELARQDLLYPLMRNRSMTGWGMGMGPGAGAGMMGLCPLLDPGETDLNDSVSPPDGAPGD